MSRGDYLNEAKVTMPILQPICDNYLTCFRARNRLNNNFSKLIIPPPEEDDVRWKKEDVRWKKEDVRWKMSDVILLI